MARFKQDQAAQKELAHSLKLGDMRAEDYDTIFYVGGHGPMWDLAETTDSIALIEVFLQFRQAGCCSLSLSGCSASGNLQR